MIRGIILGLALLSSAPASAGQKAFSQTKHVTLNVAAFDERDHVIGDLNANDFQITDQGNAQRIGSFRRNDTPGVVVILFDLLNDSFGAQGHGAQEIARVLQPLESSDSVYLYLLTRQADLRPVRGLDSPPSRVPWTEHIRPLLDAAMENAVALRQQDVDPLNATYSAIDALGSRMASMPGRKTLLWISHGLPVAFDGNSPSARINRIATALDNAGVTMDSNDQGSSVTGTSAAFEQFAKFTGGKVFYNEIDKAVSEAMAGSRFSYTIQYDVPRDGKYHKVRVTSTRKGVRLQFEQGYYAN
ncbi:MAG TPA: VWA domain-containing protein [Terriglobia bacterium]|nr:VWA domain-containing protein [Terriglobia bacterium]